MSITDDRPLAARWIGPIVARHRDVRGVQIRLLADAGWTQAAIGKAVGMTGQAVGQVLKEMADSPSLSSPDLVAAAVAGLDGDARDAAAKAADSGSHRTRKRGG